jgi:hypothetical protein
LDQGDYQTEIEGDEKESDSVFQMNSYWKEIQVRRPSGTNSSFENDQTRIVLTPVEVVNDVFDKIGILSGRK